MRNGKPPWSSVRRAELTAAAHGRTIRIDPGDQTFLMDRLVRIRHKLVIVRRKHA